MYFEYRPVRELLGVQPRPLSLPWDGAEWAIIDDAGNALPFVKVALVPDGGLTYRAFTTRYPEPYEIRAVPLLHRGFEAAPEWLWLLKDIIATNRALRVVPGDIVEVSPEIKAAMVAAGLLGEYARAWKKPPPEWVVVDSVDPAEIGMTGRAGIG